jgi:hypothetical protein
VEIRLRTQLESAFDAVLGVSLRLIVIATIRSDAAKAPGTLVIGSTADFVSETFLLKTHRAWLNSIEYLGHD